MKTLNMPLNLHYRHFWNILQRAWFNKDLLKCYLLDKVRVSELNYWLAWLNDLYNGFACARILHAKYRGISGPNIKIDLKTNTQHKFSAKFLFRKIRNRQRRRKQFTQNLTDLLLCENGRDYSKHNTHLSILCLLLKWNVIASVIPSDIFQRFLKAVCKNAAKMGHPESKLHGRTPLRPACHWICCCCRIQ